MSQHPPIDPEYLWRRREPIVLHPHDPAWLVAAAEEARRILEACGDQVLRVEHIGSTSVPGLIAKPVLDLMPIIRCYEDGITCVEAMRGIGYWYAGEFGIAGRHYFVKGSPRTHHTHMLVEGSKEAIRHVAVRDTLRNDPAMRYRYARLKESLAAQFVDNREAYSNAKGDLMGEMFAAAGVD